MQNYLLIFCIEVLLIPHFSIDNIPNPSGLKYDFIYFNFEKKKKPFYKNNYKKYYK